MRIPVRAVPYVRLAKRLLLGPGSLEDASFQQEILCRDQKTTIPPPVFLPGQLDKVITQKYDIRGWGRKTREDAIAEVTSTAVTYAPTIAYHIKNAVLFDGCVYIGRFKQPIAHNSLFISGASEPRPIKTCALASSFLGTKFFGHWLTDDCTRYLLAEKLNTPVCVRMPAYPHRQQYETYLNQSWGPTDRAFIDHLIVFQDFSQNSLKQERYRHLRNRIKAHFTANVGSDYVYLRRGRTGTPRIIQNEQEILDALIKRGFVVVDVGSDELEHIIGTLLKARLVVSLEGSHVSHCTYTIPESSGLLILQPSNEFSAVHRDWAESLGVKFGFVVGSVVDHGYHFSVLDILRTIDLMLKLSAR